MAGGVPGLILVRHGERLDYAERDAGRNWVQGPGAARPWDPPLTGCGMEQASAAGRRIAEDAAVWGVLPPRRVFTSPFLRCAQTAAGVAAACGAAAVRAEPGVAERMCEKWFRSWAVPGATSKYGGPPGSPYGMGEDVPREELRREALLTPAEWILPAAQLRGAVASTPPTAGAAAAAALIEEQGPGWPDGLRAPVPAVTWGSWDTADLCSGRGAAAVTALHAEYPSETLCIVGHGGPARQLCEKLIGQKLEKGAGGGGYCCVYVLKPNTDGGWDSIIAGSDSHSALRSGDDSPNAVVDDSPKD